MQDITGSFQQLSGCLLLPGKLKRRQALRYRTNHRHAGGAIMLFGHFHKEKPQDHHQNFLHLRYVLEEFPVTGPRFLLAMALIRLQITTSKIRNVQRETLVQFASCS